MSGHSKWANIKVRKGKQDAKRSGLFSKMIKEIYLQAKSGPDPNLNASLAAVIERARAINLPKENIERAIKRAAGGTDAAAFEEITYEGYGPEGVAVLVRVVTDNRNRAAAAVRHIFSAHGGNLASSGSVAWLFDRRGVVAIEEIPEGKDRDEFLMLLIELGAQEFEDDGETIEAYSAPAGLPALVEAMRNLGITPARSEVTMVPKNLVRVEGHAAEKLLKLLDELDDNEDVQEVFANSDITDEVMAKLGEG